MTINDTQNNKPQSSLENDNIQILGPDEPGGPREEGQYGDPIVIVHSRLSEGCEAVLEVASAHLHNGAVVAGMRLTMVLDPLNGTSLQSHGLRNILEKNPADEITKGCPKEDLLTSTADISGIQGCIKEENHQDLGDDAWLKI